MSEGKGNSDIVPKTNEKDIPATDVCKKCIDSYRFLSNGLASLVETHVDIEDKTFKNVKRN